MISRGFSSTHLLTILILALSGLNCADSSNQNYQSQLNRVIWPEVTPGPYSVGYRVIYEYDHTRTFKPKYDYFGAHTAGQIDRPLQISVWYPIEQPSDAVYMKLKEYYEAQATETDFSPPTRQRLDIVLERLKRAWPLEFRVPPEEREALRDRIDEVFREEVFAIREAAPAEGPFPLIVHMPGYNGSPSGHAYLFEFLASHGYVIAAVPNMGMYRRNIDNEAASLDVQARDLEFVTALLSTFPFVDGTRVGTTGMSWGGMSNVLFAERNSHVDAVLTLDGAITMPEELKLIEAVPGYSHRALDAAYIQLLVCPAEAKFRPKDLSFYDSLEYCDAHMIQYSAVGHDDFACNYQRLKNLKETDPDRIAYLEKFTRDIYHNTLQFFDAYLKDDSAALQSLAVSVAMTGEADTMDSMIVLKDYKKKKRRPMSRHEFVNIIKTLGAEEALEIYNDYCKFQPRNNLIVSSVIGPLYMDAFESGDIPEALAICDLWETGLPNEPGPLFSKGRIYTQTGEKEKAILCYEKILELVDEGVPVETARRRLQELRSNPEGQGQY